jgi:hypothetical protein
VTAAGLEGRSKPPKRKRVPKRLSVGQRVREGWRELWAKARMWAAGDRRMITVREMVERIQDEDKMLYMDYKLRDLHRTFLMPRLTRHELRLEEGEEVECDFRQTYHLPAVIRRVHPNRTFDVQYTNGEVVRNALLSSLRWVDWTE